MSSRLFVVKFTIFTTFFVVFSKAVLAQEPNQFQTDVGSKMYERLAETQKEYDQIITSGDSMKVAEVSYKLGKRYIGIGDFYSAEKWLSRALRILEPLGNSEELGKIYMMQAGFPSHSHNYTETILLLKKAIKNFNKPGLEERLWGAYTQLAGVHMLGVKKNKKQVQRSSECSLDSALFYFKQAERLLPNLKSPLNIGMFHIFKSAYFPHPDTAQTIRQILKAHNIFLEEKYTAGLISSTAYLGNANFNAGNFREAKKWLDRAVLIADTARLGTYDQLVDIFEMQINLNKKLLNWEKAFEFQQKQHELVLKAVNSDRDGAISRLKMEYDEQKKELQLNQQKKISRISIFLGIVACSTSIVFFLFFRKYRIISKQNAALVEEQNHRVKNNLQQITSLISLQSIRLTDDEAKKAMNEALLRVESMALVHQRLYDSERLIEINLASFIPRLTEGILKSYNYHKFVVDYQLEEFWLHVDQAIPLALILNELITNACKYAFKENPRPQLTISCLIKANQVLLIVTDNGPGFDQKIHTKTFGLKLIHVFSERLKGIYSFENSGRKFHLTFKKKIDSGKKKMIQ